MSFPISAALLDAIVLSVVAQEPEGTYGYKITQQVTHTLELSESTLYPVLRRLQKDQLLTVYDAPFNGRNRRYYKITSQHNPHRAFSASAALFWNAVIRHRRAELCPGALPYLFRHILGAAQFLDGLANLLTNLVVGIIRCLLTLDVLPAKLLVGLGCTEEIGGQFSAAHVIQNLLALL